MKHKNSNCKRINKPKFRCFATNPLLRFKLLKGKYKKNNRPITKIGLPKNLASLETTQTLHATIPTTKSVKTSRIKPDKNDPTESVSIVQMPSEFNSNKLICDDILNVSAGYDSENDKTDKYTSITCLMSTSNEKQPYRPTVDLSDIKNSSSIVPSQVNNSNLQSYKTTSKGQNVNDNNINTSNNKGKYSILVNTLDGSTSSANMYELNHSKYLVVLKPGNIFYFIGILELELVQGSIEALGYSFSEQKKKIELFSPLAYSHIFIKATGIQTGVKHANNLSIQDLLHLGLCKKFSREVFKKSKECSVFILSRKKNHISCSVWPHFFETHLPFSVLSLKDLIGSEMNNHSCHLIESRIGCILGVNVREQGKEFTELPEWLQVVEEITFHETPKVILCGGKSVGKSTFLRYLINKLLKKLNKVLVLDFDPGQCEFTVPGCISVTLVQEPLLGPNFTHLKQPLRSVFLGEVDVTKCPEDYIEGYKYLIKHARKEHGSIPWLVNTMGFSKGFGVTLTCGIIQNVGPTNVIQIESKNKKFNFPSHLQPEFVNNQQSFHNNDDFIIYNLHTLQSAAEFQASTSQKNRGLSPLEARNLVVLSYLSNMLNSVTTSLSQVTPYMISMDQIDVKTTNKCNLTKDQITATMNGNLVALCCQTEDDVYPNCLGFGIVRGIDTNAGVLYLITPETSVTLKKVNCLIKGNVNLPESLFYNQGHHIKGHIPYMAYTSGGSTALFAKRDYRTLPITQKETTKRQFK